MKSFLFLAVLLTQMPLHAKDVIGVGEPGKVTYIYSDGNSIWVRKCEDYLVVKKLSDCKSISERNIGTPAKIREDYITSVMKKKELIPRPEGEMKKVLDEKRKMEEFKKAYGNPSLTVENDPIIDREKFKALSAQFKADLQLMANIQNAKTQAQTEVDQGLAKVMASTGNIAKLPSDPFQAWLVNADAENLSVFMAKTSFKFGICDVKHDGKFFHAFKGTKELGVTTIPHEFLATTVPPQGQHVQNALAVFLKAGCLPTRDVVNGESAAVSGASGVVKSGPSGSGSSQGGSSAVTNQ